MHLHVPGLREATVNISLTYRRLCSCLMPSKRCHSWRRAEQGGIIRAGQMLDATTSFPK